MCDEILKKIIKNLIGDVSLNISVLERMGGLTNNNYKVKINSDIFVLRIPTKASKKMVERNFEEFNNKIAYKLGVDKSYFLFNKDDIKLSKYISEGKILSVDTAKEKNNIKELCNQLKILHNSKKKFKNTFNYFKMIKLYEDILHKSGYTLDYEYFNLKEDVKNIYRKIEDIGITYVPCHNDLVPENCIKQNKKIYFLDWEYSSMNDSLWDLASFSLESELKKEHDLDLLNNYFDSEIYKEYNFKFDAYKILQDFLWGLWSNVKTNEGEDFLDYGLKRFERCKRNISLLKY
ncbi:MAG: choline kinase [Clostridium sp.]